MSFETVEWSLAKDHQFIEDLAKRSAEFIARVKDIPSSLDELSTEAAKLDLKLQLAFGELNALSEKRFIENRVAEVHETKSEPQPPPERKPATEAELREAVRLGLKAFGLLPPEELSDSDVVYDDFVRERPFPYIIGSKEWLQADFFAEMNPPELVENTDGDSLISEAMQDLVLPMDDIEEATEAAEWFERESASSQSVQGVQSVTEDLAASSETTVSTTEPPAWQKVAEGLERRGTLFDDDTDDDDGDLFGIPKTSFGKTPTVTPKKSQDEPIVEQQPAPAVAQGGPLSFLDELKRKTDQKQDSGGVKTVAESRQDSRRPSADSRASQPNTNKQSSQSLVKHEPTPKQERTPLQSKRLSLFDSDSDSDTVSITSKSSAKLPSLPKFSNQKKAPESATQQSLASAWLDGGGTASEVKQSAAPAQSKVPVAPKAVTPAVPQLPRKQSIFDDSDSDSDLFGTKPKATKASSKVNAPLTTTTEVPVIKHEAKENSKERLVRKKSFDSDKIDNDDFQSAKALTSPVRPNSSESETDVTPVAPVAKPKKLPSKKVQNLFDSDSEDDGDLFGAKPPPKSLPAIPEVSRKPVVPIVPPVKAPKLQTSISKEAKEDPLTTPSNDVEQILNVLKEEPPVKPEEEHRIKQAEHPVEHKELPTKPTENTIVPTEEPIGKEEEFKPDMAEKKGNVKKLAGALPAGLLDSIKAKQKQLGIAVQTKPEAEQVEERTPEGEVDKPEKSDSAAKTTDTNDVVQIAKGRTRGPTGRRLPSRQTRKPTVAEDNTRKSSIPVEEATPLLVEDPLKISENEKTDDDLQANVSQITEAISTPSKVEPVETILPEPAVKKRVSEPSTTTLNKIDDPQITDIEQKTEPAVKPKQAAIQSSNLFASDSSDDDLFLTSAKKSNKLDNQSKIALNSDVVEDILYVRTTDTKKTKQDKQKTEKKTTEVKAQNEPKEETKSVKPTTNTKRKSLFEESDESSDDLFGTKSATPVKQNDAAIKTTLKTKQPSVEVKTKLFDDSDDSDDLFKKS